jgi:hypothetical protein
VEDLRHQLDVLRRYCDAADPVGWTEQVCDKVLPRLQTIGA